MPAPPMPDTITIHAQILDESGQPVYDGRGRPEMEVYTSKARVKETGEAILTRTGITVSADLEVILPAKTKIQAGNIIEWTDEFGTTFKDVVEDVRRTRSYAGKTYYRKAFTLHT